MVEIYEEEAQGIPGELSAASASKISLALDYETWRNREITTIPQERYYWNERQKAIREFANSRCVHQPFYCKLLNPWTNNVELHKVCLVCHWDFYDATFLPDWMWDNWVKPQLKEHY